MAQTHPVNGGNFKISILDETAFTASGVGLFDVQFDQLKQVYFAMAHIEAAGYLASVYSITGNTVRFYIYKSNGAAAALLLVGAAGDLGAASAMAVGR